MKPENMKTQDAKYINAFDNFLCECKVLNISVFGVKEGHKDRYSMENKHLLCLWNCSSLLTK